MQWGTTTHLRHALASRPRVGQPRVSDPRTSSRDTSTATTPRSHRDSNIYRQDGTSLSQNRRPDIRYEARAQPPSSGHSGQTSAPSARQGARRNSTVRFEEPDRDTRPRSHRSRRDEAIDDETGSEISGTFGARQEPPRTAGYSDPVHRRTHDSAQPEAHPRRPSNTRRESQASFDSNTETSNYALNSRERHGARRAEQDSRQDEPYNYRSRPHHADDGRTERRLSTLEQQRPTMVQPYDSRHPERAPRYRDEGSYRDRGAASQPVANNKRHDRDKARDEGPSSPSKSDRRDAHPTTERRHDGRNPVQDRGDRHAPQVSDSRRAEPSSPTQARYTEGGERHAHRRSEASSQQRSHEAQPSLGSSSGIWQEWSQTPQGRWFRMAYSEGKTALIQFHDASGPYYDADHNRVEPAKAAAVIALLEGRARRSSVNDSNARPQPKTSSQAKVQSQRQHSSSDTSSGDEQPYPTRESRHSEGRHPPSGSRKSQRDGAVDGLERKLASTSLNDSRSTTRRGLLAGKVNRDDPNDDDDVSGGFGSRHLDSGSQRHRPSGPGRSRLHVDDDEGITGVSNSLNNTKPVARRGLLARKVGRDDPNDDDDVSGGFGSRHLDPGSQRRGPPGPGRPRPHVDDDEDIKGAFGARR